MISEQHVQKFALYNQWQNQSHYREAGKLTDEQRRATCGAFFKSIHGTLSHLLWADQIWMSRFAGTSKPHAKSIAESPTAYALFDELHEDRKTFDRTIIDWSEALDPDWLNGDLTWFSGATGRELTRPRWLLVAHMFNHQTHHRGQVHAMLTSFGLKPDATDIAFIPEM
jgi:uncharacterized damage-inducible protein DinB